MRKIISMIVVLTMSVMVLGGCSSSEQKEIIIMDGNFSEMWLIHNMVKILVEEHTDAKVTITDEIDPIMGFEQLVKGENDILMSYDGTILTTYLRMDTTDVPEDQTIYEFVKEEVASEEYGLVVLDQIGLNNTYAVGVTDEVISTYNISTLTELAEISEEIVFGAEHGFFTEAGSMKYNPFVDFYGFNFKSASPIDLGLKYSAIESGQLDAMIVYTTDGLNKKAQLTILEDDQEFFPEYNGALIVREGLFEEFEDVAPNLEEVLNSLGGMISNEEMTEMTYAVDVEGADVYETAYEFLQSKNLID